MERCSIQCTQQPESRKASGGQRWRGPILPPHTVCWGDMGTALLPWELLSPLPFTQSLLPWSLRKALTLANVFLGEMSIFVRQRVPPKPLGECFSALISYGVKLSVTGQADFPATPEEQCFKLKSISIHPCARNQVIPCLSKSFPWLKANYLVSTSP